VTRGALSDLTRDELAAAIREHIQKEILFRPEPLADDEDLFDLGFDSMSITRLLVFVEKRCGLLIEEKDYGVDDLATVNAAVELVFRVAERKKA
jgi:D-alanine--poly(phosphoribitol) ligase subunit 2